MHLTEVTGKQKRKNDDFLWPQKDDRQLVKKQDILYVLLTPPIAVDRVHFKVSEQATIDSKMQLLNFFKDVLKLKVVNR